MSTITKTTFSSISCLLNDLKELNKNNRPLALYNRLVQKLSQEDENIIKKHVDIFKNFLSQYSDIILNKKTLPEDAEIVFRKKGDKIDIYVDIGKIYKNAPEEERTNIMKHLLTLHELILPGKGALEKLENPLTELGIDTSTNEGKFVQNIFEQAKPVAENIDSSDPSELFTSILSSGLFKNMATDLKSQMDTGSLDVSKLFGTMQSLMTNLTTSAQGSTTVIEELD